MLNDSEHARQGNSTLSVNTHVLRYLHIQKTITSYTAWNLINPVKFVFNKAFPSDIVLVCLTGTEVQHVDQPVGTITMVMTSLILTQGSHVCPGHVSKDPENLFNFTY